jgi:site-specific DNA-methyltransferase (adenine-specific)
MPISTVECCDCMDFMAKFPDKFFDLAIVDPPYRDNNQPTKDMRANGSMRSLEGRPPEKYWQELYRVSVNQITWGANNFQLPQFKGFVVWEKGIPENFTMSMAEIASLSEGLGTVSKIYKCRASGQSNRIHPTQKPVALYVWLLQNYAKPGDKILDTHMGSQSSRIAAHQMGFDFWGCEIDPEYFADGCKRFEKETEQQALFTPETTTEEQNKLFEEVTP